MESKSSVRLFYKCLQRFFVLDELLRFVYLDDKLSACLLVRINIRLDRSPLLSSYSALALATCFTASASSLILAATGWASAGIFCLVLFFGLSWVGSSGNLALTAFLGFLSPV